MNKVTDILFDALLSALNGKAFDVARLQGMTQEDWQELVRLSQKHNVLPLVCDGLSGADEIGNTPSAVARHLAGLTIVAEEKYAQRVKVIEVLAKLFAEQNIPLMVLKGYGVSLYYPQPNHRSFSDVDIYNFGQIEKADQLTAERLGITVDSDVHHHTKYVYRGVLVENHFDFIEIYSHRSNAEYEKLLKAEAAKDYTAQIIGNQIIRLPSPMFNALFLMRHMAGHYAAERVSVRHLCDWKQFVEKEGDKTDWQRVNEIYEQFNMKRFADAVTNICIEYLSMKQNIIPDTKSDRALEDRIVNDILYAEFDTPQPKGAIKIVLWKTRRYLANRWKHELIYNESWVKTFFCSTYSHLLKPKTITH